MTIQQAAALIKETISSLSSVIGIAGLAFGLYQYYIAQKWKKSEFAAQQLEKLDSDPDLALCCKILDWSERDLPVPERYKSFTDESAFHHDWELLCKAMVPEQINGVFENWKCLVYRDIFDRFFAYLERINHFIEIRLVSEKDVSSLEYWLEEISHPRFADPNKSKVFIDFIQAYEYSGVIKLIQRFDVYARQSSLRANSHHKKYFLFKKY